MSLSVESLRTFVVERLAVAAEEIFRAFQQKMDGYEDEVNYQRRLVESVWRPEVKLHRLVCQEEGVPTHQHQDGRWRLDQEDSKPPAIKEEPEEPCCHQDGEQLTIKLESVASLATPIHKENKQSEDPVETSVSPEPGCDLQLPSNRPHVAESQDQENYNGEDSGSTPDEEPKPTVKQHKSKGDPGNAKNPADSAADWNTDPGTTSATCHTGEKPPQKTASDLTGHSPVPANDNADAHSACGKGSKASRSLSAHTKDHTGAGPFKCETCGKEFKLSAYLKKHARIHTGERPYVCKTCGKTLSKVSLLNIHMRTHRGERPFSCKICGKTVKSVGGLKAHARIHTGERPYVCKTCGKTFNHGSSLNIHMRTHTGERPYSCNTCEKTFSNLSDLKAHMRIHTGERPYVCKTCGKAFSQSSHVKVHMRTHTGERLSCKTCGKYLRAFTPESTHKNPQT